MGRQLREQRAVLVHELKRAKDGCGQGRPLFPAGAKAVGEQQRERQHGDRAVTHELRAGINEVGGEEAAEKDRQDRHPARAREPSPEKQVREQQQRRRELQGHPRVEMHEVVAQQGDAEMKHAGFFRIILGGEQGGGGVEKDGSGPGGEGGQQFFPAPARPPPRTETRRRRRTGGRCRWS